MDVYVLLEMLLLLDKGQPTSALHTQPPRIDLPISGKILRQKNTEPVDRKKTNDHKQKSAREGLYKI